MYILCGYTVKLKVLIFFFLPDIRFKNIKIWMCVMAAVIVLELPWLFEINVAAIFFYVEIFS